MSDLIDRQALKAAHGLGTDCADCKRDARSCQYDRDFSRMDFCEWIDDAPTASPWHRVEEELPRGQELVIVAVKDTAGDTPFWYTACGWITTDGEYWIVDNEICDYVVAWMPLPEPPKEENNGSSRKEASSDL